GGSPGGDYLARGRDPGRPRARGPSNGRVSRRREEDPGGHPDAGDARAGALFRRGGRDAAGAARAVRESGQPRVGTRAPQAVLPQLQLRAPGRRHRGRDRPVARTPAQLPARGRVPVPEARDRGAPAGAGDARRADVRLALAVVNAKPYAFLDDAPLEERRTQAVITRRGLDVKTAEELGKLDQAAIDRVREEAWPDVSSSDELHDALLVSGALTSAECGVR